MKKNIAIIYLVFLVPFIYSQSKSAFSLPEYFYKKMEGKIGEDFLIKAEITRKDTSISGYYYYINKNQPIYFTYNSRIDDYDIHLFEDAGYDENYNQLISGSFTGKFINENEITGIWKDAKNKKSYPFYLRESYPEGSMQFEVKCKQQTIGNCDSVGCASILFFFPQTVSKIEPDIQKKINQKILKRMLVYYEEEEKVGYYNSIDERIDDFFKKFKEEIDSGNGFFVDYRLGWENDYYLTIVNNENGLLSIQCVNYTYTGGAHGGTQVDFLNFDINTGEEIKLEDLFIPSYKTKINKLGEKIFRQKNKLKQNESLEKAGFWFENNEFKLNENFGFNCYGIVFQFNQYEIAPYAFGPSTVEISYKELKDLLKPGTVISKFLIKQ